jgi:CHASE2 domain-containing sensor protein/signal transduction histidine kinase
MPGSRRRATGSTDRSFVEWLLVTVFCAAVAAAATGLDWAWRLDQAAYDAAMSLARPAPDDEVVIVAIDDASLAEIGRWPWRRSVHAALIERLSRAGVSAIGLDIILHEPGAEQPDADRALADAIAASGRVVLPVVQAARSDRIVGEALPVPLFAAGAGGLGHIHVEFDPDGIARSVYLWEGFGATRHPQLGLAVLQLAHPERAASYPPPAGASAGDGAWHRADWLRIPFSGPPGSYRHVSYAEVLRGDVDDALLRDKVVFVGATALGMADSVPTPTSGFNRPMPGVEVNASVYAALKRGEGIALLPAWQPATVAAVIVIALMVVMLRAAPRVALLWAAVGVAGTLLLTWFGLHGAHVWFPPAGALIGCVLCYPLWSWRRLEAAQRYLDDQLDMLHEDASRLFPLGGAPLPPVHDMDLVQRRIRRVGQAVERLRQMRRFIADTLDSLPVGALVADPQGRIVLGNREALRLLQVRALAEVPGALAALSWPPGIALQNDLPRPSTAGTTPAVEIEGPGERFLMVQVAELMDDGGQAAGIVIGISDITRIREAQRGREETMHYLSHDLRSPMASILTLIEAEKLAGTPAPEALEFLRQLSRYANSALKLADDLFRLVRAEAIDQERFTRFGLADVAQDAIDEVWALARAKQVQVVLDADETVCAEAEVRGDQELVRRALINLLGNAVKYGPEQAQVRVTLAREDGDWAVAVSDQGEGITPAQMPGLFRRFGRLKTAASRRESGVGLGLMIVKTVAERHGGRIRVASTPGQGTTFTLTLPAATGPADA